MSSPETRLDLPGARAVLRSRLAEPAPGRIQLLAEPRQVPRVRPLVLCDQEGIATVERAGLPAMPWREFLLAGPP